MASPTLSSSNCTNSGNNTASNSWAISRPAQSTGDLILCHVVWDDSTDTTSLSIPNGPGGETPQALVSAHTGGRADQRISVWYWIAASNQASGSHTVTPSASEQWTATVVRVPAGEFDATTPIGANATGGNSSNSGTTVPITAFTAGATDGDGRLCAWLGVDDDPITSTPDGWTNHASEDPGAVSGTFSTRNAAVTNSESIGSVSWGIAGDSSATYAYILRAPIDPNGTATPGGLATTASLGTATSTGAATATPGGLATTASLGTATSTGAATAAPGGLATTATLGEVRACVPVHYWDAEDVAWDDGITAWDACAAASVAGEALPVGLALASALSTVTASGTATAAVTGQATTAVLGTVTAAGAAAAIVEGLAITASLGTAVASANAIALPAGQEMAAAIGTVTASGTATAAPVGQWAEMAIGISIASGAAVGAPSGQSVTAHVGSVTPTGDGNAQVAGLLLASYLGTVVATGDAPPTFRAAWARGCNTYLRAH